MRIYLDNAATTPLDPEVFEAMVPFLKEEYGNPSSTHAQGRTVRAAIEKARKQIAEWINCTPGEIIFTSGGTEANNTILSGAVDAFSIRHAITSPVEHHAVLHTLEKMVHDRKLQLHYVKLDECGHVDLAHLDELLHQYPGALVSLMQANNEIGNLLDIEEVSARCRHYQAFYHTDAVQGVAHYQHNLQQQQVSALSAAAHKFHGPKGVGFMFIRKDKKIQSLLQGGPQERSMRGGTENVYGIIGMAKALEIAYRNMDEQARHISNLKSHMILRLQETIPGVRFHGDSANLERSLYTVLNVSLPESGENDMLLFNLDLQGISVSGGSACSSGAAKGSHVLDALYPGSKRTAVRFSFSKFNTTEEIDRAVNILADFCRVTA
ncbi:MAG: cysteine desulfurase [Cyclobacteriaceae bacterium]|jgi:cysteine desulfurase|nr:cysteine desulfurase [Cyclobacteriaceae bacterium]